MKKPTPSPIRVLSEGYYVNWKKIRTTCAWILFGFGCIPTAAVIICAALLIAAAVACATALFVIGMVCLLPGMLLAPGQKLNYTYSNTEHDITVEKGTWNWSKLGVRGEDNDSTN